MPKYDITFCTTALARPEILDKTYESFFKNLNARIDHCILYINIDPIPNDRKKVEETLEVARKYFKIVAHRCPKEPNFSKALNFCWSGARTEYIFQLEDDWILTEQIHLEYLMHQMDSKNARELILRAYPYEYDKLALSPSIWKRELFSGIAGKLEADRNPEVQLRDERFAGLFSKGNIWVVGDKPIVKDIGREWLVGQGLKKPVKGKFVRY